MAKVRLTKNELKQQKDALERFQRYLPMLVLKKKQLQLEIFKAHQAIAELADNLSNLRNKVLEWVDVFGERVGWDNLLKIRQIKIKTDNVAGVDIPVFLDVEFDESAYSLLLTPLWVDKAIEIIKETLILKAKLLIYHRQLDILKEELRIATQRVNLFEKIKIPQAIDNIRVIRIYLGELQIASVVRGKIAKAKLEKRRNFYPA